MSRVVLLGAGTEAQAAAVYFSQHEKREVLVRDDGSAKIDGTRSITAEEAASAIEGGLFLRSPGVPPVHPLVALAAERAALATTPTGYWLKEHAPRGTVTVTGTKGKSSTARLTADLLCAAGLSAAAYGNIGEPPLRAQLPAEDHPVLEVSSYMMHDLPESEHLHVITTLFRDHLDWHGSEAAYRAAKLRPFLRPRPARGFAPRAVIEAEGLPASVTALEDRVEDHGDALVLGSVRVALKPGAPGFFATPLRHALRTALAVGTEFAAAGTLVSAAEEVMASFRGLPSRQEIVPSTDGRLWVNDALSTIPQSAIEALKSFEGRDVAALIGGADRDQDFTPLEAYLAAAPSVTPVLFGPAGERVRAGRARRAGSFAEAIDLAAELCPEGGVILFSPAAASSPPHASFRERAALFAQKAAQA